MKPIHTFIAVPSLPVALEPLRDLAYNLRWAWHHDSLELFRRLDGDLWEETGHNPLLMLGSIDQAKLGEAAADEGFMAHLGRVMQDHQSYMTTTATWYHRTHGAVPGPLVAYFSAEFGLTECLSIFAGGLGMLAGDHLKSASDLGVPLVGVGLLYQQGYFQQQLNAAGWQQETYADNDFHNMPLILECRPDNRPLTVQVAFPGRQVTAQIWRVQVGRVRLYLLDTNIPANHNAEDRNITDQLYGGDREMRLKQELILGIGGYRAIEALGLRPAVYHMNEGHSAFLALEKIRRLMETENLAFSEARIAAASGLVFTTHTPVAAGHDYFAPELMDRYFDAYARTLGLTQREFLGLGRQNTDDDAEPFCMTVLALRLADRANAVSQLHGEVSRRAWQALWPGVPENEVPIAHVTNGVHFQSWISREMKDLYDRYLSPRWREEVADRSVWDRTQHIASEELWRTHERRRERMVAYVRGRLRQQLGRRSASQAEIDAASEVLNPDALTIGFARRFATYKRATLLLRDPARLARILNNPDRPVQIVFAGKAHPQDNPGKELIRQIVELSRQEPFRRRLVFVEDYDMALARYLVQGSDVWLNTPVHLSEASGTSGMKAAANGVLNLSILDGWWDEAYQAEAGWAFGAREMNDDPVYQDHVEAEALYDLLEREVVPLFYERAADGLPRHWISRMKTSIQLLCPFFTTHRMVGDYTENYYLPAAARYQHLTSDALTRTRALAAWQARVSAAWPRVRVERVDAHSLSEVQVGASFSVEALVALDSIAPKDVTVQLCLGSVDSAGQLVHTEIQAMESIRTEAHGRHVYRATGVACRRSGRHGVTVRVLPCHPDLAGQLVPALIAWA